jgi:hypothetical protein
LSFSETQPLEGSIRIIGISAEGCIVRSQRSEISFQKSDEGNLV